MLTLDAFNYELCKQNLNTLQHLKEVFQTSICFDNAFSIGPSTAFSFPGIIGSVYPYYFGVGIHNTIPTIDQVLKDAGYHTAFINESNALLTPYFGYCRGMDYQQHFLNLSHALLDRKYQDLFLQSKKPQAISPQRLSIKKKHQLTRRNLVWRVANTAYRQLAVFRYLKLYFKDNSERFDERIKLYAAFKNSIVKFIEEQFTIPQFLWIHTIINHLPYFPPTTDQFSEKEVNHLNFRALSGFTNNRLYGQLKCLYLESLKTTDMLLGELLQILHDNGVLHNSLLVITSDHGEEFQEEGFSGHSIESSSDRLLHVPLLLACPDCLSPQTISTPVSTIDIAPTIIDLLGLQMPRSFRGKSLVKVFEEECDQSNWLWQRPLYSEAWKTKSLLDTSPGLDSINAIFTIRQGPYKLKITQWRDRGETGRVTQECELKNWVTGEKISLDGELHRYEQLYQQLHLHLNNERAFASGHYKEVLKQCIQKVVQTTPRL